MGLFDGVLGGLMGAGLTQMLAKYIEQHGGLQELANRFQQQGLGEVVQSWIGSGANLPVSAAQITQIIGQDQLSQLAAKFSVEPQRLAQKLAELLPETVNRMTPDGVIPHG